MFNKDWGYINYPEDANSILSHLSQYANYKNFVICELGVATGRTGNRMVEHLKSIGVKRIKYYGVDNLDLKKHNKTNEVEMCFQFKEMEFINGDSSVLSKIKNVDFGFVDACHCAECVYKDGIAMSKIIKSGGTMAFHDTSLSWQYPYGDKDKQHWQHYLNGNKPTKPLNVVEGIMMGRAKWDGEWELIRQDGDELIWGGIRVYQKA
jgi:hypothetical protein